LTAAVKACESRSDFVQAATLRPTAEVLDALQLTLLQHWAVHDAFIHQRDIPSDLD
jgi:hypothetical protein